MPSSAACTSSRPRSPWPTFGIGLALLAFAAAIAAADAVRVFQLENRGAAEVKALVEPMMPASVNLSATGFKLLARGPEEELERLAGLVRELDAAAPDIIIETRRARGRLEQRSGGEMSGSAGGGKDELQARVYSTPGDEDLDRVQRARGQAGRPVFISRGLEVPVRDRDVSIGRDRTGVRERTHYRRLNSGFYATAALSGQRVRVEIHAADDSPGKTGQVHRRRLLTTVTGALGEWLLVGATSERTDRDGGGITYRTRDASAVNERLWLRVRLAD